MPSLEPAELHELRNLELRAENLTLRRELYERDRVATWTRLHAKYGDGITVDSVSGEITTKG